MAVISNCISLAPPARDLNLSRAGFGLYDSDFVVVCVAAWNKHQKRIDYLIEEVARIQDPSVKLDGPSSLVLRGPRTIGARLDIGRTKN